MSCFFISIQLLVTAKMSDDGNADAKKRHRRTKLAEVETFFDIKGSLATCKKYGHSVTVSKGSIYTVARCWIPLDRAKHFGNKQTVVAVKT